MEVKKSTWGGKRPGSGPKPKGKETVVFAVQVDAERLAALKTKYPKRGELGNLVKAFLNSL